MKPILVWTSLRYDNFPGRWGEQKELDRFLQAYAVEKSKIEARHEEANVASDQHVSLQRPH